MDENTWAKFYQNKLRNFSTLCHDCECILWNGSTERGKSELWSNICKDLNGWNIHLSNNESASSAVYDYVEKSFTDKRRRDARFSFMFLTFIHGTKTSFIRAWLCE